MISRKQIVRLFDPPLANDGSSLRPDRFQSAAPAPEPNSHDRRRNLRFAARAMQSGQIKRMIACVVWEEWKTDRSGCREQDFRSLVLRQSVLRSAP